MHNEATRREKSVREKSQKETTDKQNDREGEKEREFENIFRWKQKARSYHLVVGEKPESYPPQGKIWRFATSSGAPPAPDITGTMLYPLEYICKCVWQYPIEVAGYETTYIHPPFSSSAIEHILS